MKEKKRKKTEKREIVVRALLLALFLVSTGLAVWIFADSDPFSDSKKIWLPKNYSSENLKDDEYVSIISFKGTTNAFYLSFEAYRELFSGTKSNIAVEEDGAIYYVTEFNGKTFYATNYLYPSGFHSVRVTNISADGLVDIRQERDGLAWIFGIATIFLAIVCAFFVVNEFRDPTFKS